MLSVHKFGLENEAIPRNLMEIHHCVMIFLIKIRSLSNSNECNPSVLRESLVVLGKTVTNESYVHEEVKSRLHSGNTSYS